MNANERTNELSESTAVAAMVYGAQRLGQDAAEQARSDYYRAYGGA